MGLLQSSHFDNIFPIYAEKVSFPVNVALLSKISYGKHGLLKRELVPKISQGIVKKTKGKGNYVNTRELPGVARVKKLMSN